jgi:hypothetical protein
MTQSEVLRKCGIKLKFEIYLYKRKGNIQKNSLKISLEVFVNLTYFKTVQEINIYHNLNVFLIINLIF